MRIAVDLSAVATAGTKNYAAGFGPAMLREGRDHRFKVFCSKQTWDLMTAGSAPSNAEWEDTSFPHTALRLAWEQTMLPGKLKRWKADVCFSPFDTAPLGAGCPILLAVRNPMPTVAMSRQTVRPGLFSRARVQHAVAKAACRKATRVFFPTAFASNMIGGALNVPEPKRAVVFHGTDREFWRERSSALPERLPLTSGRYILFVSRLYPQKRADVLIDAYADWRRSRADGEPWRLVVVGSHVSREREAIFNEQIGHRGIADEVMFLNGIPRTELRALYQHAGAFVMPTEIETFGQAFVEALAAGAPVIAADRPFARELCHDAALYVPAGDRAAFAQAIARVTSGDALRESMIAKGHTRADAFSWTREAAETLSLLESVGRRA